MTESPRNRIELHRQAELKSGERKVLDDIETYGCHIIHVRPEPPLLGWSYTIGVYETLHQSEFIVVGLKADLAQSLLNDVASRAKRGLLVSDGCREKDLLANVECEFRKVERRWAEHLMGLAGWFYGEDMFPVMQCIYPDLENRFPWEHGFDETWRDRQALLFLDTQDSVVESDFWAANNPNSSLFDWKFEDPPHTLAYTTKRVMNGEEPIVYVSHDAEDGAWQFHGLSESKPKDAALVCLHHMLDKDATIKTLADLPRGWTARREKPSEQWIREVAAPDLEGD